ncbi:MULTISPECIES: alpha/beta hydrolase [Fusobacterium]|uniref:alpha/beta hydrolase n=1 Tax=Fusobacterium TaxID=848 RepID=UPI001476C76C|nr:MULTISPECIES: alpha/beta hydrolase-fold protein [Fusobacterium]NME35190.1 alpha/beta hydrolase [Fusobacterium sp. FSA-380-WT-3A]
MIIKEEIFIKPFKENRLLHIYLPDDIEEGERFPVMYMFDGHNLFYDSDATYGKSWGIKNFLDSVNGRVIIVGIECNHEGNMRLCEFSPYSFTDEEWGKVKGFGKKTTNWIADILKPYIDSKFPTLPEREFTGIGGSSMGGLMSVYGIATRSDVFSKAACVSPFYDYIFGRLIKDIENSSFNPDTTIYISWGKREFAGAKNLAIGTEKNLIITRMFTEKGAKVFPHLMISGGHDEASWEKELPSFFSELGFIE